MEHGFKQTPVLYLTAENLPVLASSLCITRAHLSLQRYTALFIEDPSQKGFFSLDSCYLHSDQLKAMCEVNWYMCRLAKCWLFLGALKGLNFFLELSKKLKGCWEFKEKLRLMELYQAISPKSVGIKQVSCTQIKRKADISISNFAGKDLGSQQKADNGPAMCPCSKSSQKHPGLLQEHCCQWVRGGDSSPLHSLGETHLQCYAQNWAPLL